MSLKVAIQNSSYNLLQSIIYECVTLRAAATWRQSLNRIKTEIQFNCRLCWTVAITLRIWFCAWQQQQQYTANVYIYRCRCVTSSSSSNSKRIDLFRQVQVITRTKQKKRTGRTMEK